MTATADAPPATAATTTTADAKAVAASEAAAKMAADVEAAVALGKVSKKEERGGWGESARVGGARARGGGGESVAQARYPPRGVASQ